MDNSSTQLSGHFALPEPQLLFAKGRRDLHPLRGLLEAGPYGVDLGFPIQNCDLHIWPQGICYPASIRLFWNCRGQRSLKRR
jgi:hypothetical protein